MRAEHHTGREAVADALRTIADGVASGRLEIGGGVLECDPDVTLVVEPAAGSSEPLAAAVLHLTARVSERPARQLDRELSHPGG